MNVRWLTWKELLAEAGILRNVDAILNQIEGPEARRIAQAVNLATDFAWKFHPWECACWFMRNLESSSDEDKTPLVETGYAMMAVYAEDPLAEWDAGNNPKTTDFRNGSGTIRLYEAADIPFYLIRTPPPRFGGEARDTATAYAPGALAYDSTTGECWRCTMTHTNTAFPTWQEWKIARNYEPGNLYKLRRNGVLFTATQNAASSATNEPAYGSAWSTDWSETISVWTPMRLPEFLLPAVLAGARSWMENPNTGAMQEAMLPALETEISDFSITRRQRRVTGGTTVIL